MFFAGYWGLDDTITPTTSTGLGMQRRRSMISAQRAAMTAVMMLAAGVQLSAPQEKTASEKTAAQGTTGRHYVLPPNAETPPWGWLHPPPEPKLGVDSRDTPAV